MQDTLILKNTRNTAHEKDLTDASRYTINGYLLIGPEIANLHPDFCPWSNPRLGYSEISGTQKNPVHRNIREALNSKDGSFHRKGHGIYLYAEKAVRREDGSIYIDWGKRQKKGVCDGGTNVMVLNDEVRNGGFVQSEDKSKLQFIYFEIRCGGYEFQDALDEVKALNTNLQVNEVSMANYANDFKELKKITDERRIPWSKFPEIEFSFGGGIGVLENGSRAPYKVGDVLKVYALMTYNDPKSGNPDPKSVYSWQTKKMISHYKSEAGQTALEAINPIFHDVFALHETIMAEIPRLYNDGSRSWGNTLIAQDATKRDFSLPFLGRSLEYVPVQYWVYPILSAFRAAVEYDSKGKARWIVSPFAVLEDIGAELYAKVNEQYGKVGRDIGRNADLYEVLHSRVERAVNKLRSKGASAGR